jgi:hypothetical protein
VELDLEPIERDLILRYGFPFEPIKSALRSSHPISPSRVDLEHVVGELSRSINHGDVPDRWLDFVAVRTS